MARKQFSQESSLGQGGLSTTKTVIPKTLVMLKLMSKHMVVAVNHDHFLTAFLTCCFTCDVMEHNMTGSGCSLKFSPTYVRNKKWSEMHTPY